MTRLLFLATIFSISICGCQMKSNEDSNTNRQYDYSDVEEKKIEWNELFSIEKESYLVYIYSPTCGHCNEIKQSVIEFALQSDDFYFVLFAKEINVGNHIENSIGADNIDEVVILGTPTLLVIRNHVLTDNIAGSSTILTTLTNL